MFLFLCRVFLFFSGGVNLLFPPNSKWIINIAIINTELSSWPFESHCFPFLHIFGHNCSCCAASQLLLWISGNSQFWMFWRWRQIVGAWSGYDLYQKIGTCWKWTKSEQLCKFWMTKGSVKELLFTTWAEQRHNGSFVSHLAFMELKRWSAIWIEGKWQLNPPGYFHHWGVKAGSD